MYEVMTTSLSLLTIIRDRNSEHRFKLTTILQ